LSSISDRSPALADIVGAGRVRRAVMLSSGSIRQTATLASARRRASW
jgi:hypothetical protein